ncbi:nucleotidyltransferase substrate binding protein [Mucilaginibacter glaciei]|uniref:Nucleotidyltransferase substrate binding protein n=1 Tax=Mucilaginibacter glaciei TaxID=2772109 RepID=A0A926NVC6_9SPHI|nr:nucleotidyltransferase substrate binding protein [Mucilaginibacter glaciei]MBD1392404.1 nucleotidyltransferase substrate binding protein [Mucilaginibacter glaciei]
MAQGNDIRWLQRFSNYKKALRQLEKFIDKVDLNELEEQGLIKAFEYTYELGWTTLKDYLQFQGITNMVGSRDVIREAFKAELITNGDVWMQMLQSRNLTSHSYNEDTAEEIVNAITETYFNEFKELEAKLEITRSGEQDKLF